MSKTDQDQAVKPGLKSAEQQRVLLIGLAEPNLDLAGAAVLVSERRAARNSRRGIFGAVSAVLMLLTLAGTWLVLRDSTPESVIADKAQESSVRSSTTSTTVSESSQAPSQTSLAPLAPPVVTTVPSPTVTSAPAETVLPLSPAATPISANQPMTAELVLSATQVEAGSVIDAKVIWSDPDLAAGYTAPQIMQNWGDPLVTSSLAFTPVQLCSTAGVSAQGETPLRFSYSTPGQYTLRVTLDTCAGQGAFGNRLELSQTLTVLPARYSNSSLPDSQDVPGQVFVVALSVPPGVVAPPDFGASIAEFLPTNPALLRLPIRVHPNLQQFTSSGSAAVFVLPQDSAGRINVGFSGVSQCAQTDEFLAVAPGLAPPVLQLRLLPCT